MGEGKFWQSGLFQATSLSIGEHKGSIGQITSLALTKSFPIDWLKATFLEEATTANRLAIKS